MEIQDKYIILVLVGAVLGITIILILLKIIGSIFSGFFGGYRRDYHSNYDDHEPRRSGCFIPLLILIGLVIFGAKAIRDQGFLKPSIAAIKAESPASNIDNTNPQASVQPVQPPVLDYDEVPETSDTEETPEVDNYEGGELVEKAPISESYDPYLLQTNFFYDAANAERRMAELAAYDLDVGMYLKEKEGRTGYAVYVGPFHNRQDALEMQAQHGLQGDVLPCYGLRLLHYQEN